MTDQDPFSAFESDRTVIKPSAGRAKAAMSSSGAGPSAAVSSDGALPIDALMSASLNPLVSAAMPLLTTAARLRHMVQHPNPGALKDALAQGIQKFEQQTRAQGLPNEQVIAARYILCTLLDESAASTPWGSAVWSSQSLLVTFHNETWGGEKVFQLMSKLAENMSGNRNLLELLYVTLALGFEGRYRVLDNGKAQLDSVRSKLAHMLSQGQATPEKALSLNWKGIAQTGASLSSAIPLWIIGSAIAGVLLLVYMAFSFSLNRQSDPVFASLQTLDVKAPTAPSIAPSVQSSSSTPPRLAGLLRPEIEAGLVGVQDLADRSVITIKGDGFFAPASANIADKMQPLLARIDEALSAFTGAVLITGHTDSQPIRSLRYPSNWHLSQDRANAVKQTLVQVKPERIRAEGRADAEPLADNTNAEGRSRNRRVEVTLFTSHTEQ